MSGDFFSAADLVELRAVALSAMAGTLVIKRPTRSADGMGGFSESYVAMGTVACHIWPARYSNEQVAGAQVQSIANWRVAVPVGTDIREIDYGQYNGTATYQIIAVPKDVTWAAHIECDAVTYNRELRT
jgi:hypothetical protein